MPRYKLTVAYEGTSFHGWQKQVRPNGAGPARELRTVQGVLENTIKKTLGEPIVLIGASRTDAGVHAVGQVAAFNSRHIIPIDRLARAITSRCPDDLQVLKAEVVPAHFDPITHAVRKEYAYVVQHSVKQRPLFDRRTVRTTHHKLDAERMHAAAAMLVGTHDFAGFAQINHGRATTVRTIFSCDVVALSPHRVQVSVCGSGFLYNMVRIIVGTLVDIGRGQLPIEQMQTILASADRRDAGPTIGPQGLCLQWITYDIPPEDSP